MSYEVERRLLVSGVSAGGISVTAANILWTLTSILRFTCDIDIENSNVLRGWASLGLGRVCRWN